MIKDIVVAVVLCSVVLGVLFTSLVVSPQLLDRAFFSYFHDLTARTFNREQWAAARHDCGRSLKCERLRMVKDLLTRQNVIGMTKKQVINLLGEAGSVKDTLNYCLGVTTPWETQDPWYLTLTFKNDRVIEYHLWEDD